MSTDKLDLTIIAFSEGFVDLDENECAQSFATLVEQRCSDGAGVVILDLRKCWIEYSYCYLFLDKTFAIVLSDKNEILKRSVKIKTNIDLGSKESMACLFFQLSDTFSCQAGDSPSDVVEHVDALCGSRSLRIQIEVYDFDQISNADLPRTIYEFPSAAV